MSDLSIDDILEKKLAGRKEIVDVDEPEIKLVIFTLGEDWFAFPGRHIREILSNTTVFFVPGCPPSLEGVINVRGDIESVIRLNELLQLPLPAKEPQDTKIMLGKSSTLTSGIRVDEVVDVVDMPESFIQPPSATLPEQLRPFVSGVFSFGERAVTLLDLEQIFTSYFKGLG